jgi:uncharacterized RDD family membrane protein YckC
MESESQPPDGPQAPPPSPPTPPQAPPYDPLAEGEAPSGGWDQPIPTAQGWEGRPLASWGSRAGATLIDWLILIVPIAVLIALVVLVAFSSDVGAVALGIFSGLAYLVGIFLYAPVLMSRSGSGNGATWGKQIVGIRAVRDAGQPFDFGNALLREFVIKGLLFGTVGGWFLGIPTLLDYLWPLWDDENRCLHDMVAKTHVVRA